MSPLGPTPLRPRRALGDALAATLAATFALAFTATPTAVFAAADAAAAPAYDFAEVERLAAAAVADGTTPSLAVAISKDGKVVYERAFGLADVEAHVPATVRTAYPLASATKPITATALMVLAERQSLDLAVPVATYVPSLDFRTAAGESRPVTLRQLLGHTSGLGTYARIHYGEARPGPSLDAMIERYGRLVQEPGRVAEYSNLGYGVLGRFIERRSEQSFADFVEDAVFAPLGMEDSFIGPDDAHVGAVAAGYGVAGERLPPLYNDTPGAGNAYASVHDLLRFGQFHLPSATSPRGLPGRDVVARMQDVADPGAFQHYYDTARYGLGWYARADDGGRRVVWHEGGMPGASALLMLLPDDDVVVAVLANRTDANPTAQALHAALVAAVLPGVRVAPLDPIAAYTAYADQAGFAGHWAGTITVEGKALPCTLDLGDGTGTLHYVDGSGKPAEASFPARVRGDSFITAFPGRLPAADVTAGDDSLLLLKLVRTGDRLAGAVVAYASPTRLEYLLPFAITLERVTAD